MTDEATVRRAFADQAVWCDKLGSPLTARLMRALQGRLDRSTATGTRILDWPGAPDAKGDAVPLRLAGALHAMVRRGMLPDLAACYPPNPLPDEAVLGETAMAAIRALDSRIEPWLDYAPQTNETARSGPLFLGLMDVAARTGMPLALLEIGASAGLNLFADRFAYRYGETVAGDPKSAVVLAPVFEGEAPSVQAVRVVDRRGVDLNPLRVSDPADRERLFAYCWSDQPGRLERLTAALAIARADPPSLEKADAADWVEAVLAEPARAGVCRVLFHTIAWQYFPKGVRARISRAMTAAGEAARADAPIARLSYEQDEDATRCLLKVTLWPGGQTESLASGDAHGRGLVAVRRPARPLT